MLKFSLANTYKRLSEEQDWHDTWAAQYDGSPDDGIVDKDDYSDFLWRKALKILLPAIKQDLGPKGPVTTIERQSKVWLKLLQDDPELKNVDSKLLMQMVDDAVHEYYSSKDQRPLPF